MLFTDDDVQVFDFDNCGFAHYVLDVAVTLAQVRKRCRTMLHRKREAYLARPIHAG